MRPPAQIRELLEKYLADKMTKEEREEFRTLLAKEEDQEEWAAHIEAILSEQRYGEEIEKGMTMQTELEMNKEAIFSQLLSKISTDKPNTVYPYPIQHLHRKYWWAAAAVFLLLLGAGTLWLARPKATHQLAENTIKDIPPGGSKALLTLANGEKVTLDSAGNQVWQQGKTAIRQKGGQLEYDAKSNDNSLSYNTLTTPNGGQFKITLPDGSKVWLNAASSLRYPVAFSEAERLVEVQGEAYFEIAKNENQPFKVKINANTTVEVLGTNFNINSYANETTIATTLLTGAIRMLHRDQRVVLHPGQQAQIDKTAGVGGAISLHGQIDTAEVMAWKNGLFYFHQATLPEVMRQLARWYDIEVVYEGEIPPVTFDGKMDRHLALSQIIKILAYMKLNFRLEEGRRLVVLPS